MTKYTPESVGVDEQALNNNHGFQDLIIFPNPNNGVFSISLKNAIAKYEVKIYAVPGEKVFQSEISSSQSEINLNLSNGMYFYQVKDNKQFISTGKLIVQ